MCVCLYTGVCVYMCVCKSRGVGVCCIEFLNKVCHYFVLVLLACVPFFPIFFYIQSFMYAFFTLYLQG